VMLQIVASLTDNTRSVNYDCNTFIIQATGQGMGKREIDICANLESVILS
jgi:hypothetical protein